MTISNLLIALFAISILSISVGMGVPSAWNNQYIDAVVGVPGYINIWPYSYSAQWQLYDGDNILDGGAEQYGVEDWFVSSNRDWYAEVYDCYGFDGHLYSGNYGYALEDQLTIYPFTYGYVYGVDLSNSHQILWAGPPGDNLWLDTAYQCYVGEDEPEDFYYMGIGAYAYTAY